MDPDAIAHPLGRRQPAGIVRSDDEGFVPGPVQMFKDPQHRIRDTIDVGQEGFGDYCNTHVPTVLRSHDVKIAPRDMGVVHSESIGRQWLRCSPE